ncbi:MAG: glycosyltransferase family 4 protein [Leptolinea sp.]|jgi:glycosyltransferase involved in cell wall biosynthesis|nr:glycosyltransferase family 4 protein [Leptolinea sp.]
MNFIFVCPESEELKNCVERRCVAPARAINRTGRYSADLIGWRDFVTDAPEVQDLLKRSDYIIIHRGLWSPLLTRIQHWKARDKTIIADFVDAYQLMDEDELADVHDLEINGGIRADDPVVDQTPLLTQLKWTLQLTHGATTPSQRLCDDWNPYSRTLFLPDYIDLDRLNLISPQDHEGINLGWFGTIRRLHRMKKSGIMTALEAVCQMRRNARIIFYVDHPEAVGSLGLPADQVEIVGWNTTGGWQKQLSRIDIGLVPMIGDLEQRSGCSPILEFMALKIPWIASQGAAVYDLQSYGWIVENTAEAWLKAAIEMIDYLNDYRSEAAITPYLYALSKSLEENVQSVVDTFVRLGSLYSTRPLGSSPAHSNGHVLVAKPEEGKS